MIIIDNQAGPFRSHGLRFPAFSHGHRLCAAAPVGIAVVIIAAVFVTAERLGWCEAPSSW